MTKPIFLLGEAYGENESRLGVPFVGAAGIELLRQLQEAEVITLTSDDFAYINKYYNLGDPRMIDMVWQLHPELYRTNVFNIHPPRNDLSEFCGPKALGIPGYGAMVKSGYCLAKYRPELERLQDEILTCDPNLILCLGNTAIWALTNRTGISKVRGTTIRSSHCVDGYKLLPTFHPAAILRQWENRPWAISDLMKAKRENEYPEIRRPHREIWVEPSIEDMERFYGLHIRDCKLLSVDIETAGNQITCIGFAPSHRLALVVPFLDTRRSGRNYWNNRKDELRAWQFVRATLESSRKKVFQNGLYDIAFLWRAYGIRVMNAEHDTMLAHHALQPESPKALGFLGSLYCDEGPWKTERKGNQTIKRDE